MFFFFHCKCDIKNVNGLDRGDITIQMRNTYSDTILSKMERDLKYIGKILFRDKKIPKFFEDFKIKVDISRQKARKDKLTFEEYKNIITYFDNNKIMQSYLTLAFESLGRPQEILYTKISDVELFENYSKISVSEHGKEGIKVLISIDSFPYLIKMLETHPFKDNKESYFFLNTYKKQLTLFAINKKIKKACNNFSIDKPITCYSLKRFGVTWRRLQGDNDVTIQRIAGWTSTRQLKIYDQSEQEDIIKLELIKRGLLKDDNQRTALTSKVCQFCGETLGFNDKICSKCKHILDPKLINRRISEDKKMNAFLINLSKKIDINTLREIARESDII